MTQKNEISIEYWHPYLDQFGIDGEILEKYGQSISFHDSSGDLVFHYRDISGQNIARNLKNYSSNQWKGDLEKSSFFYVHDSVLTPNKVYFFECPLDLLAYEQLHFKDAFSLYVALPYFFKEESVQNVIDTYHGAEIFTCSSKTVPGNLFDVKVYLSIKNRLSDFKLNPGYASIVIKRLKDQKDVCISDEDFSVFAIRKNFGLKHSMKTIKPRSPLRTFKEALWKRK